MAQFVCKMSAKRQIFKLSTLKKLLNEENSCVSLVSCTRLLLIPPFYLNDTKGGVIFSLNKLLKKYDQRLNGIIIGYQNITIILNEDSGIIRMGGCEPEFKVRVEFYVFQPRIGNILEGLINKKSDNHIGCLVHHCFNATILRPEDVTFEDWICKDYNINDKVKFKVKDLDFTGSVPYIEGDIDESLFNQCSPNLKNPNCDLPSNKMLGEENEAKVSQKPSIESENVSSFIKHEDNIKDEKKKNIGKKKFLSQVDHSIALNSLKSALNNALNNDLNRETNKIINSELKTNESMRGNNTADIVEEFVGKKTRKHKKNQDEVDKGEENEEDEVKKKKDKKSKKKGKEGGQMPVEVLNTLTEENCVGGLHDDGVKKEGFDPELSKSKKKKKRKKDEPSSESESPKKTMEVTLVNEENDNVFYSTQLDPSKKSEKLNITFCSPILPEPVLGNKKRKKEKDKRQQVLESSLALVNKEEKESSTKDKKEKSLKRKRERESESEGLSTPKKYKNGNMYDVVYSQSPQKTYVENKSLFSDSEQSFKMSPFKKGVKLLNGDIHDVLENCDTEKDVHKPTVQSLLDEIRKEVSERFQGESKIQNRESCQGDEKNKESKTVKVQSKEEKTTKKKKKKKEKEKNKIKESEETSLKENTATSLYEKLLQEAMNSINLTNDDVSSASSASKPFEGKKQRRKKRTKESVMNIQNLSS